MPDNAEQVHRCAYAASALLKSPRQAMAERYLAFLAPPDGQAAYAKFGFVSASAREPALKPIA